MEEEKGKINIVEEILKIFWVFMIGSFLGYIFEMIIVLFQKGHFESRQGLIYGPLTPVYGIGGVIYYLTFKIIKTRDKGKVFLISMVLGGVTEYLCSFIQEKVFGTISWDYSEWLFNINGRTTLIHCTYWGIGGILFMKYVMPLINHIDNIIKNQYFRTITALFAIFMLFNISVSSMAAIRQDERNREIAATSNIDVFFDTYYSDEVMDEIYENKIEVKR